MVWRSAGVSQTYTCAAAVTGRSGSLTGASTSATGVSGVTMRGWKSSAARRPRAVPQQPTQVLGLDGLHCRQQPFTLLGWQFGEQVRGVVRLHLFHYVGAALEPDAGQQPDLVLLGISSSRSASSSSPGR